MWESPGFVLSILLDSSVEHSVRAYRMDPSTSMETGGSLYGNLSNAQLSLSTNQESQGRV